MLKIAFFVRQNVHICETTRRILLRPPVRRITHKLKPLEKTQINKMADNAFKFTNYDCIGFDLDNTLTRYKISALLNVEYKALADYLINQKGYPAKYLSKPIEENLDFMMRGLVLDAEKGNVLHIDSDGHIVSGTHGTKELSKNELVQYYGSNLSWDLAKTYTNDPLANWNGEVSLRMRALLDYFDMPAGLVFARAVDSLDENNNNQPLSTYKVYEHIFEALNNMFSREKFKLNEGGFFPDIKSNPETYYHKSSANLINWLKELKEQNKVLFVITGSNIDFASHTAENSLGENWKDLFDIVIFFAKKPGFFTQNRPFIGVKGMEEADPVSNDDLKLHGCYTHGNWKGLHEFLKKHTGNADPKMLYIGDNLVQDVYAPATSVGWDTVAVCEELQAEGFKAEYDEHIDKHFLTSAKWGSYFSHADEKFTVWKKIISNHSRICVPSLEYVAQFPVDHEFSCVLRA